MKMRNFLSSLLFPTALCFVAGGLYSCTDAPQLTLSGLDPTRFATDSTALYTLTTEDGRMEVCFTNFGGRIVSIMVPDREGNLQDVCLGFDNIDDYIATAPAGCNFGALIGRYGNRIGGSRFTLDGTEYALVANDHGNSLHGGGDVAFHNRIWTARQIDAQHLEMTTTSPDGEDGYPGTLDVKVIYSLTADHALQITYEATTDKPTVVNLTNHCYFCLSGDPSKDALSTTLAIAADHYTPVDSVVAVTGEIAGVEGTPMDFTTPTPIGQRIDDTTFEQLVNGHGYDHNWVLRRSSLSFVDGDEAVRQPCATLTDPTSGITMDIFTDQPGLQFYAGNFLDGSFVGKRGIAYPRRSGLCFETQHFPDSPNRPDFPSTVLRPGETYHTTTVYKFR